MTTIIPERLAQLDTITLDGGAHTNACPDNGMCFVEFADWLTGGYGSDHASHISPVLRRYGIRLNDQWGHEKRQQLRPYGPRLVGTAGDGLDELRRQRAAEQVAGLLVPWLRLAGLDQEADRVSAAGPDNLAEVLRPAQRAAWDARSRARSELEAKIRAKLGDRPDAAAVAVTDAAAAADAADAVAAAGVAADVAAVAGVSAAAAADAADAVAAAGVAADVAAVAGVSAAAGVAAAAAAVDTWDAQYQAAREYFREHPLPVSQQVADLAAKQDGAALDLLDKLIDPKAA